MNKIIFFLLLLCTTSKIKAQTSIYDFKLPSVNGTLIDLNDYRGKKILIVNTASQSELSSQLAELEQLYQQYKDSGLVVVAVPSNDFGNEVKSDEQIRISYASNYNISFPITAKQVVSGNGTTALYNWLTKKAQNGVMETEMRFDFQKFLVNGSGRLVGSYMTRTPKSRAMIAALQSN